MATFLIRKITRSKWKPNAKVREGEIAADTITSDLRTTGCTLSCWASNLEDGVTPDESSCKDAILALVSTWERFDKIDITWLIPGELDAEGIAMEKTPGDTPIPDLVETHIDLTELDMHRLCATAQLIFDNITTRHVRLTKSKVRNLLIQAIREGRVERDALNAKLRKKIEEAME